MPEIKDRIFGKCSRAGDSYTDFNPVSFQISDLLPANAEDPVFHQNYLSSLRVVAGRSQSLWKCFAEMLFKDTPSLVQMTWEYIKNHKAEYKKLARFSAEKFKTYLEYLQQDDFLGDEATADALCQCNQCEVWIYCFRNMALSKAIRFKWRNDQKKEPTAVFHLVKAGHNFRIIGTDGTMTDDDNATGGSEGFASVILVLNNESCEVPLRDLLYPPPFVSSGEGYRFEAEEEENQYVIYRVDCRSRSRERIQVVPSHAEQPLAPSAQNEIYKRITAAKSVDDCMKRFEEVLEFLTRDDALGAIPITESLPEVRRKGRPKAAARISALDDIAQRMGSIKKALEDSRGQRIKNHPGPIIFFGFANRGKSTSINKLIRLMLQKDYQFVPDKPKDRIKRRIGAPNAASSQGIPIYAEPMTCRSDCCVPILGSEEDVQEYLTLNKTFVKTERAAHKIGILPTSHTFVTTTCLPMQIIPGEEFKVVLRYKYEREVQEVLQQARECLQNKGPLGQAEAAADMGEAPLNEEFVTDVCFQAMAMIGSPEAQVLWSEENFNKLNETDLVIPERFKSLLGQKRIVSWTGISKDYSSLNESKVYEAKLTDVLREMNKFLIINTMGSWSHWGLLDEVQVHFPAQEQYRNRNIEIVDLAGCSEKDLFRTRFTQRVLKRPFSILVHVCPKEPEPGDIDRGLQNAQVLDRLLVAPENYCVIPFVPIDKFIGPPQDPEEVEEFIKEMEQRKKEAWFEIMRQKSSQTDIALPTQVLDRIITPAAYNVLSTEIPDRTFEGFGDILFNRYLQLEQHKNEQFLCQFLSLVIRPTILLFNDILEIDRRKKEQSEKVGEKMRKLGNTLNELVLLEVDTDMSSTTATFIRGFFGMTGAIETRVCRECTAEKFEDRSGKFEKYNMKRSRLLGVDLRSGASGNVWDTEIADLTIGYVKCDMALPLAELAAAEFEKTTRKLQEIVKKKVEEIMSLADEHIKIATSEMLRNLRQQLEVLVNQHVAAFRESLPGKVANNIQEAVNTAFAKPCEEAFKKHDRKRRLNFLKSLTGDLGSKVYESAVWHLRDKELASALNAVNAAFNAEVKDLVAKLKGYELGPKDGQSKQAAATAQTGLDGLLTKSHYGRFLAAAISKEVIRLINSIPTNGGPSSNLNQLRGIARANLAPEDVQLVNEVLSGGLDDQGEEKSAKRVRLE